MKALVDNLDFDFMLALMVLALHLAILGFILY